MTGRNPYTPRLPNGWWLETPFYIRYMIRELSSFFVGTYVALLAVGLWRLGDGPDAWARFTALLASPPSIAYHVVALAFALYHTVTWFGVAPRTMPMQTPRGDFVPARLIIAAQYVVWAVVSAVVLIAATY